MSGNGLAKWFQWIRWRWMDRSPNQWGAIFGMQYQMVLELYMDDLCDKMFPINYMLLIYVYNLWFSRTQCEIFKIIKCSDWTVVGYFFFASPSVICVRLLFAKKCWNILVPLFMPAKKVANVFIFNSFCGWTSASFDAFFHSKRSGSLYLYHRKKIIILIVMCIWFNWESYSFFLPIKHSPFR